MISSQKMISFIETIWCVTLWPHLPSMSARISFSAEFWPNFEMKPLFSILRCTIHNMSFKNEPISRILKNQFVLLRKPCCAEIKQKNLSMFCSFIPTTASPSLPSPHFMLVVPLHISVKSGTDTSQRQQKLVPHVCWMLWIISVVTQFSKIVCY